MLLQGTTYRKEFNFSDFKMKKKKEKNPTYWSS